MCSFVQCYKLSLKGQWLHNMNCHQLQSSRCTKLTIVWLTVTHCDCDTASNCMAGQNAWVATIEKPKHLSAHKELFVAPTQNYNLRSIPVFALKPTLFCIFNQVSLLGTLTWQYIFLSSTNPHSIKSLCICHFIKLGNMRPSAVSSLVHVGPE